METVGKSCRPFQGVTRLHWRCGNAGFYAAKRVWVTPPGTATFAPLSAAVFMSGGTRSAPPGQPFRGVRLAPSMAVWDISKRRSR